jgi:toxin ParE1/3/4
VRVVWRKKALNDLARFHQWLSTLERGDPDATILKIKAAADMLADHDVGRPGGKAGTRELSLRHPPYVIAYRADADTIEILAVYHTAQNR